MESAQSYIQVIPIQNVSESHPVHTRPEAEPSYNLELSRVVILPPPLNKSLSQAFTSVYSVPIYIVIIVVTSVGVSIIKLSIIVKRVTIGVNNYNNRVHDPIVRNRV
jgi:hypothetical protein